jgi:plasmid rolling circle replication initiator protein Rep
MQGYKRLCKIKEFKKAIIGTYRTLEITHNEKTNHYHPHFHIIGAVKKHYFKSPDYINQRQLSNMWKEAYRCDYDPVVDIRKVKKKDRNLPTIFEDIKASLEEKSIQELQEEYEKNELATAAAEVAKYPIKMSDVLKRKNKTEVVETLDSVMYNRRFISYGGILDEARKQLKIENKLEDIEKSNLINITNEEKSCTCSICQSELIHGHYLWDNHKADYFKIK